MKGAIATDVSITKATVQRATVDAGLLLAGAARLRIEGVVFAYQHVERPPVFLCFRVILVAVLEALDSLDVRRAGCTLPRSTDPAAATARASAAQLIRARADSHSRLRMPLHPLQIAKAELLGELIVYFIFVGNPRDRPRRRRPVSCVKQTEAPPHGGRSRRRGPEQGRLW